MPLKEETIKKTMNLLTFIYKKFIIRKKSNFIMEKTFSYCFYIARQGGGQCMKVQMNGIKKRQSKI